MDEAHNARTDLSFETLARLKPALIIEFTATPVTPEEHNPAKGVYASNVLYHVSAAELKAAEMIKLPVVLRGRPDPKETIGDALAWLDELGSKAAEEKRETGEFVRPVMLIQAAPRSKERPTLHAEEVKKLLREDFRVPDEHIAIATGDTRELDKVDLFDRECRIRFIITQAALREGWDCSFAYVLCSVAEQKSSRAVEQILGCKGEYGRRSKRIKLVADSTTEASMGLMAWRTMPTWAKRKGCGSGAEAIMRWLFFACGLVVGAIGAVAAVIYWYQQRNISSIAPGRPSVSCSLGAWAWYSIQPSLQQETDIEPLRRCIVHCRVVGGVP